MKRIILTVLAVLICVLTLGGCGKVQSESVGEGTESGENNTVPEGDFVAEWGGFSVYIPEDSILAEYGERIAVKNDTLCCSDDENSAEFAKILSVEQVKNATEPFAPYDELYKDGAYENSGRASLGNIEYCAYDFQTEIETEAFGRVYENKTVYCLLIGDEIVVIEFYPLRGIGISAQKAEFEKILCSVSKIAD